ncbi:hypothetical protein [Ornithinimicrobium sp. INDO-MA30-4]|uniref:HD domain-containing protein n=1 Tax=Ornithinimicrobium sp. INDO-MA30-4 TaxID=2908651 RepID=UPI001F322E72|nr:hypothetical protein [Ornithinimicrobium sp. INDO-MA30-4]UJH69539.1 hypothetical protein L0A91_09160 [Ornithinimicrobium sp. INDO-MA30-4]
MVDAVEALILATVTHDGIDSGDVSAALSAAFNDADLWILSAPPRRYAEYARDVRTEYAHVPDAMFAAGRTQIMAALIDRPQVYATSMAQAEGKRPPAQMSARSWPHSVSRTSLATLS